MKLTDLELAILKALIKYKFVDKGTAESTMEEIMEAVRLDAEAKGDKK